MRVLDRGMGAHKAIPPAAVTEELGTPGAPRSKEYSIAPTILDVALMDNLKLLHLHLPKTGGTALRRFFATQVGEDSVTPTLQDVPLSEALLRWEHTTIISGHFIARQADAIPLERTAVTVLRDPVDRFLSDYFYNKFDVDNLLVEASSRARDFDTYLKHLCHSADETPMRQLEMLYPLGTEEQTRLSLDQKLAASKNTIDQIELVGLQEELDDFCSMLCAKFGWEQELCAQHNVTSRRLLPEDLTASQRRAVNALLEPEINLYTYAQARFKRDRRNFIAFANAPSAHPPTRHAAASNETKVEPRLKSAKQDFGDLRCEINAVEVIGRISGPGLAMTGETMDILFHVASHETLEQVNAGIAIKDEFGSLVFGTNSLLLGEIYSLTSGKYVFKFTTLNRLGPGNYTIDAALTPTASHYDGCFHWRHAAANLCVPTYATQHFEGKVLFDIDLNIESASDNAGWCKKLPVLKNNAARAFGISDRPLMTFHSSLDVMSSVDVVQRRSDLLLQVKVTNSSTEAWPARGRYPVKLSYRWLTADGVVVVEDGIRTDLPNNIAPGASVLTCMLVRAPDQHGMFYLATSAVQENVAWFINKDETNGRILPINVI